MASSSRQKSGSSASRRSSRGTNRASRTSAGSTRVLNSGGMRRGSRASSGRSVPANSGRSAPANSGRNMPANYGRSQSPSRSRSSAQDRSYAASRSGIPNARGQQPAPRYIPSRRAAGGRYANSASQAAPRQSRSVGEIRREERERARRESMQRAARKTRLPLIIVGAVIALVVAVAVTYFILSHTGVFKIENIQFEGVEHLTDKEVDALVDVPPDATLLNVDANAIKNSLSRVSWVKSVDVNKKFPSTLEVVVHERPMAAVVEIPMGVTQTIQNWAIADDGVWLMAIPNEDSEVGQQINPKIYEDVNNVPHITGIQFGLTPELGEKCTDENVNNALSILTGMTTELADQVKTISASDSESTQLTLDNNIEIAFGKADNIREKERICLEIMEKNPNAVVYINVRVPDRATFRKI